jgi:hypothetical protein
MSDRNKNDNSDAWTFFAIMAGIILLVSLGGGGGCPEGTTLVQDPRGSYCE